MAAVTTLMPAIDLYISAGPIESAVALFECEICIGRIGHRALRGAADHACVFGQHAVGRVRTARFPGGATAFEFHYSGLDAAVRCLDELVRTPQVSA